MQIFILAGYFATLLLQSVDAVCPWTCTTDLSACFDNYTKPGYIVDANGCLTEACVPSQPLCCPPTSKDNATCEAYWVPTLIMDQKTGCNTWTCAPKQPKCCPRNYPTRGCLRGFHNFEVYDEKTGCLYWTCVPGCENPPPAATCPEGTKPGHVYQRSDKCLNWTCVPNQATCCRKTSPDTIKCTADSEPGLVMDPDTGCNNWQCVPEQPYCCKTTFPVDDCAAPKKNFQVYDQKTGCYVWECREDIRRWYCGTPYLSLE